MIRQFEARGRHDLCPRRTKARILTILRMMQLEKGRDEVHPDESVRTESQIHRFAATRSRWSSEQLIVSIMQPRKATASSNLPNLEPFHELHACPFTGFTFSRQGLKQALLHIFQITAFRCLEIRFTVMYCRAWAQAVQPRLNHTVQCVSSDSAAHPHWGE